MSCNPPDFIAFEHDGCLLSYIIANEEGISMRTKFIFPALFLFVTGSSLLFQGVYAKSPALGAANTILQSTPVPAQPTPLPTHGTPPLSLTIFMGCMCVIILIIIGVFVMGFITRRENIKEYKKRKN